MKKDTVVADRAISATEQERLSVLRDLKILDTARQPNFDAVVKLAQDLFQVPISAISLIDQDRQWFKAIAGLDMIETDRTVAFCDHTIRSSQPFVVSDATNDKRFQNNPLVTGAPSIRFYGGVPLALKDGLNVGSLCIIDDKPRLVDDEAIRRLALLGDITVSLLTQHKLANDVAELLTHSGQQEHLITHQATALANQRRILDDASRIAKMGAWERNLETGELEWSDGMFALHEMDRSSEFRFEKHLQLYPEPDRSRLVSLMETATRDQKPFSFEGRMYTAKGNLRWIRLISQVDVKAGKATRRFGFKQDITDEKAMGESMRRLAEIDDLTGAFNRRVLYDRLAELGSSTDEDGKGVYLYILDLDGFKDVNDTYGHGAGDACLKRVARRLRALVGDNGLLARLGGDEFGIVRKENTKPGDRDRFEIKAIRAVSSPIKWRGHTFQVSSSVGISTREQGDKFEPNELMREADLALYDAKNSGRGCYRYFRPALAAAITKKCQVLTNVRKALALDQLELYYQPKVRIADNQHSGFEALLRINRADGVVLAPGSFAEALDDPLLSKMIGDFVVSAALDQAKAWARQGTPFHSIAINLSASQFRDPDFADAFLAGIRMRGLTADMIQVEVTEGIFLSSSDYVLTACQTLKRGGIRIAFDDFGTGFASLTHLRDFPVDIIKIDRSFISEIATVGNAAAIVNAMVSLGNNLSMDVVAEGVETPAQAEFLRAIGCGMAQGYRFARPMPASDAAAYLEPIDLASSGLDSSKASCSQRENKYSATFSPKEAAPHERHSEFRKDTAVERAFMSER